MEKEKLKLLERCPLKRGTYLHRYTTGSPELDEYFRLNSVEHQLPKNDCVVNVACVNYLFALLGIEQTGIAYTQKGYIVSYWKDKKHLGTYLINDDSKAQKMVLEVFNSMVDGADNTNPFLDVIGILNESGSLLEKCLSINESIKKFNLFDNQIWENTFKTYKEVDGKNCRENHRILCRLICGTDDQLYNALERYVSELETRKTGEAATRSENLTIRPEYYLDYNYIPDGLPEGKTIKFFVARDIFNELYRIIIDNYYVFSGGELSEEVLARSNEGIVNQTPNSQAAFSNTVRGQYESILAKIRNILDEAFRLFKNGERPPIFNLEKQGMIDIINICMLDYTNARIVDLTEMLQKHDSEHSELPPEFKSILQNKKYKSNLHV